LSSLKLVESLSMGRDPMASTLFPSIDSSDNFQQNADWAENSYQMSRKVLHHNKDAIKVRVTSSIVREVVQTNDDSHLRKVNLGIRHKMSQTQDLLRKLITSIRENSVQAASLEKIRDTAIKSKNMLISPMDLAKRRIEIREDRPTQEKVEDMVFVALEQEHFALATTFNQIGDCITTTNDVLSRLESVKGKLRADCKEKRRALELDGNCLSLTYRTAAQHPPKEETLHTKITTMAGEVPPAKPTSVLYGENAAGRFSYEWMFTKDEREQLKVAFRNMCDESDEIMAHAFEMVYTAAGVQVNSKECPSVLEILSLHPDTKMTWPKFCELLATMRSPDPEDKHPVTLPHQWRYKTRCLLEHNQAVLTATKRLLFQNGELIAQSENLRRKQCIAVQKALRRKIHEALDLRRVAEQRLNQTDLEIRRLEASERTLLVTFAGKSKPLMVSEARYNIRRQRHGGEEIHDEVEDLIAREVEELQKGVNAIQREIDNTRSKLEHLKQNREALVNDILCKNSVIELDTKCLNLEDKTAKAQRNPFNSFIQGHL